MTEGWKRKMRAKMSAAELDGAPMRVRKRLISVAAVLEGDDLWTAARKARCRPESVRLWVARARAGDTLWLDGKSGHDYSGLPAHVDEARSEIRALLRSERRPWARKRLRAMNVLLRGGPLKKAAREADVWPGTLARWASWLQKGGVEELVGHPPPYFQTSSTITHTRKARLERDIERRLKANRLPHWRTQQRMRAIQMALRGDMAKAAQIGCVQPRTVQRWLRAVIERGLSAVVEPNHPGRAAKVSNPAKRKRG